MRSLSGRRRRSSEPSSNGESSFATKRLPRPSTQRIRDSAGASRRAHQLRNFIDSHETSEEDDGGQSGGDEERDSPVEHSSRHRSPLRRILVRVGQSLGGAVRRVAAGTWTQESVLAVVHFVLHLISTGSVHPTGPRSGSSGLSRVRASKAASEAGQASRTCRRQCSVALSEDEQHAASCQQPESGEFASGAQSPIE